MDFICIKYKLNSNETRSINYVVKTNVLKIFIDGKILFKGLTFICKKKDT